MFIPLWVIALVLLFFWPDFALFLLIIAALWLFLKALFWTGVLGIAWMAESPLTQGNFLVWLVAAWMVGGLIAVRPWRGGRPADMSGAERFLLLPTAVAMFPGALFGATFGLAGLPLLIFVLAQSVLAGSADPIARILLQEPLTDRLIIFASVIGSPFVWTWIVIHALRRFGRLAPDAPAARFADRLRSLALMGLLAFGPCCMIGALFFGW